MIGSKIVLEVRALQNSGPGGPDASRSKVKRSGTSKKRSHDDGDDASPAKSLKYSKVSINRNDSRSAKDVPSANLYDFPVNVKEEIPEINDAMMKNDLFIVKPKSKSPIPCPNRPQILTLSPDQV